MSSANPPEAPRNPRGASSWARRFNDNTLEMLAAVSRLTAVLSALAVVAAAMQAIWAASISELLRSIGTVILFAAVGAGAVHLGFVQLANPEWKEGRRGPDAP